MYRKIDDGIVRSPTEIHRAQKDKKMTTFTTKRRTSNNGSENFIVAFITKQTPEILPPLVAIVAFLAVWQIFSLTSGTLP